MSLRAVTRAGAALAVLLMLSPACGSKKSLPKGKLQGLGKTAIEYAPRETGVLAGLSWQSLKESKLYPRLYDALKAEKGVRTRLEEVEKACGMDPARELDSAVIALDEAMQPERAIVLAKGSWEEAHANECMTGAYQLRFGHAMTTTVEDGITVYAVEGSDLRLHAAWIAPGTALFLPASLRDRAALGGVLAKGSSVRDNKLLMELVGRVDTGSTAWAAMTARSNPEFARAFAELGAGNQQAEGVYAALDLRGGLRATVGLRFGSDRDAKAIAKKAQLELKAAKKNPDYEDFHKYMTGIDVSAIDHDVVLTVKLGEDDVEELASAFEDYFKYIPRYLSQELEGKL